MSFFVPAAVVVVVARCYSDFTPYRGALGSIIVHTYSSYYYTMDKDKNGLVINYTHTGKLSIL